VDDPTVQLVWLEIGWTNALGQLRHQRVEQFGSTGGEYLLLVTLDAQIPCDASNFRVSILVLGALGATSAQAYLDDLQLKSVDDSSPCPTPTLPATPTPLPIATSTPRPTLAPLPTTAPTSTPRLAVSPTPSHGLLVNGGFEAAQDGVPLGWLSHGGLLSQESGLVHSGRFAASLMSFTSSTKWIYQTVRVSPTTWYELDTFLSFDDPWVDSVRLRIAWYTSGDGSGSALATVDSTSVLSEPRSGYRHLTTGTVLAPPAARSAQVRVLLRPSSATGALIYIDDVTFARVPPPTPEPTATRTITRTPLPTATPSPAGSPTPSHGLLVNGGFEAEEGGRPLGWRTDGGALTRASAPVRSGRFSGEFASHTESTKWLFQAVRVRSNAWYRLDAYVYQRDPQVDAALLRISWYLTADGSGSAVATVDSLSQLDEPEARYRHLTTGIVQAPFGVQSASVRVLLRPRSSAAAVLYIDDVSLTAISAPTPTATAPATAVSTPVLATTPTPPGDDISPQPNDGPPEGAGDSIVGGPPDRPLVSEVLGASSDAPAAPLAPPTPVIERDSRLAALDESPSSSGWARWWLWVIAANVLGLAAVGWVAYRWGRRRHAAREEGS
jgi:hypothetical protein